MTHKYLLMDFITLHLGLMSRNFTFATLINLSRTLMFHILIILNGTFWPFGKCRILHLKIGLLIISNYQCKALAFSVSSLQLPNEISTIVIHTFEMRKCREGNIHRSHVRSEAALDLGFHPRQPDSGVCVFPNLEPPGTAAQDSHRARALGSGRWQRQ